MPPPRRWRRRAGVVALSATLTGALSGVVPGPATAHGLTGPVSSAPAKGTPELVPTGRHERIRELKECGGTVYAVGRFTRIRQGAITYTRSNIFSFSAAAPYKVTAWAPKVNGTVNTIAFDSAHCADAYIGGNFTAVGSATVGDIAEISTSTGQLDPAFAHSANAPVATMAVNGSHLLTGGAFTSINGTPRHFYASLNLATGRDDGYLRLNIEGTYQYPGAGRNPTRVYNQQVSHAGHRVLVEGDFTSAGGRPRQQIFMLFLGAPLATVTGWTSPDFSQHCDVLEPFYLRSAAWSPSDNTVYTVATGGHPYLWNGTYPLTGLCDAAAAFSADEQSQQPRWINYTGCNSLYTAVADDYAVYVAGHPRYSQNPDGCKDAGPGAIADPGMQGLNPSTGHLEFGTAGKPRYSMAAANADDMLLTSSGLWIASTNRFRSQTCNGASGHSGICFLPYP